MNHRIERKIQKLLRVGKSPSEIFDELTIYLFRKKISDDEKEAIVRFGVNAGLDQKLLSIMVDLFHEKEWMPWDQFIELLSRQKIQPNMAVIASVLKGAKKQEHLRDFGKTRAWEKYDQRFRQHREGFLKDLHEEAAGRKDILLEKLQFYKSQRMFDEQNKLIKILVRMYPDDQNIQLEHKNFKEIHAYEIIGRSTFQKVDLEARLPEFQLDKESQNFLITLKNFILESVKKEKKQAYNFAILFKLIGQPRMALEVLAHAEETASSRWLEIDLLLEAKRDIDCLDKIHAIELRFVDDPETTFAATYARARALHQLGQSGKAIDLLKSIVQIRPDYRSANSLLTEWAEKWI